MRNEKTVNIKNLLEDSPFAQIMQKSKQANQLNQQLQQIILPELKSLYRISHIENDTLHIEVANAVVRQGLLFKQQQILTALNHHSPKINKVQIKINPEFKHLF